MLSLLLNLPDASHGPSTGGSGRVPDNARDFLGVLTSLIEGSDGEEVDLRALLKEVSPKEGEIANAEEGEEVAEADEVRIEGFLRHLMNIPEVDLSRVDSAVLEEEGAKFLAKELADMPVANDGTLDPEFSGSPSDTEMSSKAPAPADSLLATTAFADISRALQVGGSPTHQDAETASKTIGSDQINGARAQVSDARMVSPAIAKLLAQIASEGVSQSQAGEPKGALAPNANALPNDPQVAAPDPRLLAAANEASESQSRTGSGQTMASDTGKQAAAQVMLADVGSERLRDRLEARVSSRTPAERQTRDGELARAASDPTAVRGGSPDIKLAPTDTPRGANNLQGQLPATPSAAAQAQGSLAPLLHQGPSLSGQEFNDLLVRSSAGIDEAARFDALRAAPEAQRQAAVPVSRQVATAMLKERAGASGETTRELRISLRPERLGHVDVRIEMRDDVSRAVIRTETLQAMEMLRTDIRSLEQALREAGYKLEGGIELTNRDDGARDQESARKHGFADDERSGDNARQEPDDPAADPAGPIDPNAEVSVIL